LFYLHILEKQALILKSMDKQFKENKAYNYMILDPRAPRDEYFKDLSVHQIVAPFKAHENQRQVTIRTLRESDKERIVAGTVEGDLEGILGCNYNADPLVLVETVDELQSDQLLVVPEDYMIQSSEARQSLVYDVNTLVKLDSKAVKERLGIPSADSKPLSKIKKVENLWLPERVLKAAFDILHEQQDKVSQRTVCGYSWWGSDGHRKIVSLYRAIQGAELRAFQNLAAYNVLIPRFRREIATRKDLKTKKPLTYKQIQARQRKIRKYEARLKGHGIESEVMTMDVSERDMIDPIAIPFGKSSGRQMKVPSMAIPGKSYTIKLTSIPAVGTELGLAMQMAWDVRGLCVCYDKMFRSSRRPKQKGRGQDEDFYCAHEIAALHSLKYMYEGQSNSIPFLPFVIPTQEMMEYVDKLRTQTVIAYKHPQTGRFRKRALNHTEIENLIWKKVMAHGYDRCFSTDNHRLASKDNRPMLYLVKFK